MILFLAADFSLPALSAQVTSRLGYLVVTKPGCALAALVYVHAKRQFQKHIKDGSCARGAIR